MADQLSSREEQVLALLVAGLCTKAIANKLNISPRTVEIHRHNVKAKLHAGNVADVVRIAITRQLVE